MLEFDGTSLDRIRAAVRPIVAMQKQPTGVAIRSAITGLRAIPMFQITDDEAEALAREIESQLDILMNVGSMVKESDFVEWYAAAKKDIEPFYWDRYRLLLEQKGFAPQVVATLDQVTDRITGLLQNPRKEGIWDRRGMVVGHVQSGKTANYSGLIAKAADAGYKLIVVIAGIHNNLRNQTQRRLDESFVGRDTSDSKRPFFGVGKFSSKRTPITLTNAKSDFNINAASTAGMEIKALNVPLLLVIKKNASTLKNLITWLKAHNTGWASEIADAPMLLIDDEADNASINVSRDPEAASRINSQIRELLKLFQRSCYVGYTATPFANIFIDPDTESEMLGADLFPRDFIVTLDPPTNYFGATRIFQSEEGSRYLRTLADNGDILPMSHKITHIVTEIPESLKAAVRTFVVARAIRVLRGHGRAHSSMLVNASRFTGVQKQLRSVIHAYLKSLERAVRMFGALPDTEGLKKDQYLRALFDTWEIEYSHCGVKWADINNVLLEAVASVQVEEVNSQSSGSLDYAKHSENGLHVIAVGGFSLSRGLTLEGLMVSYFLRNSMMYDTLLQMGRWFGYRPGYEDLCRIWMPPEAQGWYEHISESIDELRDEMRRMERANLTPKDFGLKVRSHPDTLTVTARNKMRKAENVRVSVGLSNRFIETYALHADSNKVKKNLNVGRELVSELQAMAPSERQEGSYLWDNVPANRVIDFLEQFQNHQASLQTDPGPVIKFIQAGLNAGLGFWQVAVVGKKTADDEALGDSGLGLPLACQQRTAGKSAAADCILVGNKNRVSSRGVERIGVSPHDREEAEARFRDAEKPRPSPAGAINYPDRIYREVRSRPLLLLQPLDMRANEKDTALFPHPVLAWSISVPPVEFEHDTVEYVVNTTWWRDNFGPDMDEDEEEAVDASA